MSTNVKINMHVYDKLRMCMYFWYVNMHVYVYECCTVAGKWLTLFGSMEKKGIGFQVQVLWHIKERWRGNTVQGPLGT